VVECDLDRSPAPAFVVEDRELAITVGQRVALAPAASRAERELAA
jgi:hypothetical protein